MHASIDATYSPEDDKLRVYSSFLLDLAIYAKVKAAGYSWAPKQDLFYAVWSPGREDLALELAGEITDEDSSMAERAEDRAERFDGYSDNRRNDALAARDAVSAIADGIPMGQPILVGHHSEKRARKDAERITNGMRKAVNAFATSEYWTTRAAGVLAHADYKSQPDVRARRIKKLQAERRKLVRRYTPHGKAFDQVPFYCPACRPETNCGCSEHPEAKLAVPHVVVGPKGRGAFMVRESSLEGIERGCSRWVEHLDNRLTYETALLEADGASSLLDKPKRRKLPPILNYKADSFTFENRYHRGEHYTVQQIALTKAQLRRLDSDYKGTRAQPGHRVRIAMRRHVAYLYSAEEHKDGIWDTAGESIDFSGWGELAVFLTDSKVHKRPEDTDPEKLEEERQHKADQLAADKRLQMDQYRERAEKQTAQEDPEADSFRDIRKSLKAGVEIVSAPQLFETPRELADQASELLDWCPGHRILEPSAGTGRLLDAIRGWHSGTVAIECNENLVKILQAKRDRPGHNGLNVLWQDFLGADPSIIGRFDRIIMNPPFRNGADITHVSHARKFLGTCGRLVAFCANGPRQQRELRPLASQWINLPSGSFKTSGTNVSVALLVIDN